MADQFLSSVNCLTPIRLLNIHPLTQANPFVNPLFPHQDNNNPTSPLLAKAPEHPEEVKLPPTMKFVAANTVGEFQAVHFSFATAVGVTLVPLAERLRIPSGVQ